MMDSLGFEDGIVLLPKQDLLFNQSWKSLLETYVYA